MKNIYPIWVIILLVIAGCKEGDIHSDEIIIVDVTANYPKKELILQDFMDVEYIPLETNDEFISRGFVQDIGKNILLVRNRNNEDGDIFIFDRRGKGIKKINRKGQGSEEYTSILGITLDEKKNEMFVNDHYARKILVYDLDGNFKRSFKHKEGTMYDKIYNFDQENLICHDGYFNNVGVANRQSFILVSKQDGSITKEIEIPFKDKILTSKVSYIDNITYSTTPTTHYPIIPHLDSWILVEPSSDTLFTFSSDFSLKPFIARTPSIQSMNSSIFLFLSIITDSYYFMEAVEKRLDVEAQKWFPSTLLGYDKQDKSLFQCVVYNDDYSNKVQVYMNSSPVNNEIATWQALNPDQLIEAYEKGQLKGRLKEIAAKLDPEDNPVIMLIKYKK